MAKPLVKTVFFDLDATLWPPQLVALPAFHRVFQELGRAVPADNVLLGTLGYTADEIWRILLPHSTRAETKKTALLMEKEELLLLAEGRAQPFAGVKQGLASLKTAGVELCLLSNCDSRYLQAVPDALGIGHYFKARYCAANYPGLAKHEILKKVLPEHAKPAAMVGDRWHDIEAGRENGLLTIACSYGLGAEEEHRDADYKIDQFPQVVPLILGKK